jgi:hypothetical protein
MNTILAFPKKSLLMKKIYSLFILLLTYSIANASTGDTIKVVSHQNVVMVTNPNSGSNDSTLWAVFPSATTQYRKIFLVLKYKCPSGMACGEWDYIDAVMLHRTGGVNGVDRNIELTRFITPYGLYFAATWNNTWHDDITDFATLLHDSVEITYVHTGYETNVGRGWDVTLEFNLIEGNPAMTPTSIEKLWDGSFAYGNDADPIETHLDVRNVTMENGADIARVRIHQTGHGNDVSNGCSEFCYPYRDLFWDGAFIDKQNMFRKCDKNPLYPQGGTWIYTRGNWCPGALVYPYIYDFSVTPASQHTVNIDMEPLSSGTPSGNYYMKSFLIQYKDNRLNNDIDVSDIIAPSTLSEYSRINPTCVNPTFIIKNMGKNAVTSLNITYGYDGQNDQGYLWTGTIPVGGVDTITVPNTIATTTANQRFKVNVWHVNNVEDSYPFDNISSSFGNTHKVLTDQNLVLEFKTNYEASENSYQLIDQNGNIVYSRSQLANSTTYKDTFYLEQNNCYKLLFLDEDIYGGDGVDWWANPDAGTGFVRLKKLVGGTIIKNFEKDFGGEILYYFSVNAVATGIQNDTEKTDFKVSVYPNPNNGDFTLDVLNPEISNWDYTITNAYGQVIRKESFKNSQTYLNTISLKEFSAGVYFISVNNGTQQSVKKILLQH